MTLLGIALLLTIIITALWYGMESDSEAEIVLSLLGVVMGIVGLTLILI